MLLRYMKQRSATAAAPQVAAEPVAGPAPLSPIQRWFFEQTLPQRHHYNQAVLLETREPLEPARLTRALAALLEHHDALRLRFSREPAGPDGWRQVGVPPGDPTPVTRVDLSGLAPESGPRVLEPLLVQAQASLDLSQGPLLRMVLLDFAADRPGRLLWTVHHLAVDSVSWGVLLEDLERAYRQLEQGEAVRLPAKATSFAEWARLLLEYAGSPALRAELDFWAAAERSQVRALPVDFAGGVNTVSSTETVEIVLPAEETWALLREVPAAYRTRIDDVLFTALALALGRWTGGRAVPVNVEGHGREELFEGVDLARTVGWFTSLYPVLPEPASEEPGSALKSVKEQLRAVPRGGIGYGVLRYLSGDETVAGRLREQPPAQVLLNYLGQLDTGLSPTSRLRLAAESHGPLRASGGLRGHLLEINGNVSQGCLRLAWDYSRNLHRRETVERLAGDFLETLRTLIRHCLSPQAGGCTPSDFPLARVDQSRLDRLLGSGRGVEDVYPLSPLQQGMLFHSLYHPDSGEYVEQLSVTFSGPLDVSALHRAWRRVVSRHPILRTAFFWEGLKEPLQVVYREVTLPWEEEDRRQLPATEINVRLEAELTADVRRGFDLTQAPLMRIRVIRTGEACHRFVWSSHHLLLDGWSVALLFQEVFALYEAFCRGRDQTLERRRPYRDYIAWLRERDGSVAEAFWRRALGGMTAPTLLSGGSGRQDPSAELRDFRISVVKLPPATVAAVRALAAKYKLTLNTLLQGAWSLLVARYTGADDVLFGATVSGRSATPRWVESMVGLFINTLPVRARVRPESRLTPWLKELQVGQTELLEYEDSPLDQVQRCSEMAAGQPLFDNILVVENYPVDASLHQSQGALELSDIRSFERPNYPLAVVVIPAAEMTVRIYHDRTNFETTTVVRMIGHWRGLLESAVADPHRRLADLAMLTAPEKHQLLAGWNDTAAEVPAERFLHRLFEARVRERPETTALLFEDRFVSYGELEARANRLAHHLRAVGVHPGLMVGVCLPRSPEMVVAVLAVLKAGGGYVPLSGKLPRERLRFMIEDAGVRVLLSRTGHGPDGLGEGMRRVLVDRERAAIASRDPRPPSSAPWPVAFAYVIFTSGSTGRPKGVMVRHRPAINLIDWVNRTFEVGPGDRMLFVASLGFDLSVYDVFGMLAAGGSLRIASGDDLDEPERLVGLLRDDAVTFWDSAPAALQQLAPLFPDPGRGAKTLRLVFLSGDWIPVPLPDRVRASFPRARVISLGGATEATVWSNSFPVGRVDPGWVSIPYGRPINNARYLVLDSRLDPCPIAVPGDLYIGGDCLSAGYADSPALSAEKYLPDPFGDAAGGRLYRTGDRARFFADGNLEFLGRLDTQVKIRGFRIELGEIEVALSRHPSVEDVVVVSRKDPAGSPTLVAYPVRREAAADPVREWVGQLREFLHDQLPEYMIPAAFMVLDALPVTANGKVDRKALPAPQWQSEQAGLEAPSTPVEEILAGIWAEVLGADTSSRRVGAGDDFFELGGHSLLATQLVSRIREALRVDLPLRQLFATPVLGELAVAIDQLRREARGEEVPPLVPAPRDGRELPLSFAQERLWFLDQFEPGSPAYNIPSALRLTGSLNPELLRASVNEIVRRHEALRTTFAEVRGRGVQVIAGRRQLLLPVVDLRRLRAADRQATTRQLIRAEARLPFDLTRGPLLRTTLLRLAAGAPDREEHVALFTMHHIVSDGWSMGVLIQELVGIWEALAAAGDERTVRSPLPEPALQYPDFALWQRQWLSGEVMARELAWWRQQLEGHPGMLELPTGRPRPAVLETHGATEMIHLSPDLARELEALSRRHGVTVFMTLLAAFDLLLWRYTGQRDLLVGTSVANRNRVEIENLIGFFVNTLVVRSDLTGDPSPAQLLARVRDRTLDAYAHQDLPFEKLVDELRPNRDLSRSPLFQVMLTFQNLPPTALHLAGLTLEAMAPEIGGAKFDFELLVAETPGDWEVTVEYNRQLFDRTTMRRLLAHWRIVLESVARDPERRLCELVILAGAERQQQLVEWNSTGRRLPAGCFDDLFRAQVARTPAAAAAVYAEQSLSYAELSRRAGGLARQLIAHRVGPDVVVALLAERGLDLLTAMLATFRTGAAYLPLDPRHPPRRHREILERSHVSVVLVSRDLAGLLSAAEQELAASSLRVLVLEDLLAARGQAREPAARSLPSNLAYVIYTSGSTGVPKGAMVEQRGMLNHLAAKIRDLDLGPRDRVAQNASQCFDISVWQFLAALVVGARVVIYGDEVAHDPERLLDRVRRDGITILELVPSVMQLLVGDREPPPLPGLRWLVPTGEALPPELARRWQRAWPQIPLLNAYGPTECSDDVSHHAVRMPIDAELVNVPIGRAVANMRLYVFDRDLRPVPIGVPGELFVAGAGVGRGYLREPGRTAEAFVPDPFDDGGRIYRTGDLIRFLPDGTLEFLGRIDFQVKIHGHRIELGEIEVALGRHADVDQAVVVVQEPRPDVKRLVAWLVPRAGRHIAEDELRESLQQSLPDYMVPAFFATLDALPLTANGKVDRKALGRRPPAPAAGDRPVAGAAPRTPAEKILTGIWRRVLSVDQVGVHDNFFQIGGDSILSIQLVSRAREEGLALSPRQVFQHPTIAELATLAGVAPSAAAAGREAVTGAVALTPIQRAFFAAEAAVPDHYNQAVLLEPVPELEAGRLAAALAEVTAHHDALRLRFFQEADGRWRQQGTVVAGGGPVPFGLVDLSALTEPRRRQAVTQVADQVQRSLDLSRGPLQRMVLMALGRGRRGRLLWVAHHLMVDGVSWRILLDDLERSYHRRPLPARTTSVKRWAEQLEHYAASADPERELDFWLRVGHRTLKALPVDFPHGDNTMAATRTVETALDADRTRALLREVPAVYRTNVNDVLLTALALACRQWTREPVLAVALEGHGREEELFEDVDLSRTVGWFTSLYPVLLEVPEGDPGAALKAVKEQLRAVPRGGVGYGVLRYLRGERRLAAQPESAVIFNYLGRLDAAGSSWWRPASEPTGAAADPGRRRDCLLEINGGVREGRLRLIWEYAGRHRRTTVETLAQGFLTALRELIDHCLTVTVGAYTPSDFPLAGLSQAVLDQTQADLGEVEDLYPLTAMQQGMLFHSLYAPRAGEYFEQASTTLEGALDRETFRRAWQRVVDRHPILRTAFLWEGPQGPLQLVRPAVTVPWQEQDWRRMAPDELCRRLDEDLRADRNRGFDLAAAPLMRLKLIATGETSHRLIWSFHHLLLDGWSVALVLAEVFDGYRVLLRGEEPVSPPRRPYRDYVAWLEGRDPSRTEAFWRGFLDGFSDVTTLAGGDLSASSSPSEDYRYQQQQWPAEGEALQGFAATHGLTLNTLIQGAWGLLLARYTAQQDVLFGITVSGRTSGLPDIESMVGLFINTLPLRARVAPDTELLPWLDELQVRQAELREYEHTPLTQVRQWSELPAGQPLFDHILVFENYPVSASLSSHSGPFRVRDVRVIERTNYPLTVMVVPAAGLNVQLSYDRSHFDTTTILRLMEHFRRLLRGMVEEPGRRPAELALLGAAERHQLLAEWNGTAATGPWVEILPRLLVARAVEDPDRVAVIAGGDHVTRGELEERTSRLAGHLRRLGVGRRVGADETCVGVCLDQPLPQLVAVLAVLRAGGSYLPLDPAYPRQRLAFMAEDAGARLVVTDDPVAGRLPELFTRAQPVLLDAQAAAIAAAEPAPVPAIAGEQLAYTIYTSGSTGKPKGVGISHRALLNFLGSMAAEPGLAANDVLLAVTSLSFDIAGLELYLPLLIGARLVLAERDEAVDGRRLRELIAREGVTVVQGTPATWRLLIAAGWREPLKVWCGGEALPRDLAAALRRRCGEVWNLYGPTETTVWSSVCRIDDPAAITVGRPIANTSIVLLDRGGRPVPIGVAGELMIGGAGLARGYLNRPRLTAESFFPDPAGCGERLYRTGDLARRLADGRIDCLGRRDHQVKLHGLRIELGEIEAALNDRPEVRESVVLLSGDQLVAFLVVDEETPAPVELRRRLASTLPAYMVPAAFVVLDELPLLPNGKVDRRRLAAREPGPEIGGRAVFEPPLGAVEELLAGIWSEVFSRSEIGRHDDFFALGGHSLLGTQVVSRIREAFRVDLALARFFEMPTIAELAPAIRALRELHEGVEVLPIVPVPRDQELPVSFAQQRLWFQELLHPGSPAYNIPAVTGLHGKLAMPVLERTCREIVRRHEVLRTTFQTVDGRPRQVIAPRPRVSLPLVDLRTLPAARRRQEALRLTEAEARRPFDLAVGPLFRVTLLRLDAEEHLLLITMHHIVSDAWSAEIFQREMIAVYDAFCEGRPSPLPELSVGYADFAHWQHLWLRGEILDGHVAYWKKQLAGLSELRLPVDRRVPSRLRGRDLPLRLESPLPAALKTLSREMNGTLFITLVAALQILFHRLSGQDDVALGTPVAGRGRTETEGLIGFFVNTLVLRTDLADNPTVRELLARVRTVVLGACDHQELPFEQLVRILHPDRNPDGQPLFQVMFTFAEQGPEIQPRCGLTLRPAALPAAADEEHELRHTLIVALAEDGESLTGEVAYDVDLFNRTTVVRMLRSFAVLLAGLAADSERRIGDLSLMTAAERHQLQAEWPPGWSWEGRTDDLRVLDGFGRPAPIGVRGELFAAGRGTGVRTRCLADGTLDLAAPATAAATVPATAAATPAAAPAGAAATREDNRTKRRAELARRRRGLSSAQQERLAKHLRGQATESAVPVREQPGRKQRSPLIALQPTGNRVPWVFVHPIGGTVFCYRALARCLGPEQPFYALQAAGIEEGETAFDDLPEMAAAYVRSLIDVQPRGPYLLGGWSFGGVVAFEMAGQLRARGAEVRRLVLLEAGPPGLVEAGDPADDTDLLRLFIRDLEGLHGDVAAAERLRGLGEDQDLPGLLALARRHGLAVGELSEPELRRRLHVFRCHQRALIGYRPAVGDVPVILCHSRELAADELAQAVAGWNAVATTPIAVHAVPGDHYSMLAEPNVRLLAELLQRSTGEPDAGGGS